MRFTDRHAAGKMLGKKLGNYRGNSIVYALPRGGVEVGVEVARSLDAPIDLIISRKIGHPSDPEYAIGAVTEFGPTVWHEAEAFLLDQTRRDKAVSDERTEAKRRRNTYLAGRKKISARNKSVIIVDDGMATGLTMQTAVAEIKHMHPGKIIIAVPVAPQDTIDTLLENVDEIITVDRPENFQGAIGAHYKSFPQLSDKEVIALLDEKK